MTQGAEFFALWKHNRTARSLSPTYIFSNSGPLTDMKLIPASLAIALASNVLPQPGGPQSKTPDGVLRPSALKCSACLTGAY